MQQNHILLWAEEEGDERINVLKVCAHPRPESPDGRVNVWICGCPMIGGYWRMGGIDFFYFLSGLSWV